MSEYVAHLNGEWVNSDELRIDRKDRGIRTGDVVFDTARTFDGDIFNSRQHAQRLMRSLKYARIDSGLTTDEWEAVMLESVERNRHMLPAAGRKDRSNRPSCSMSPISTMSTLSATVSSAL